MASTKAKVVGVVCILITFAASFTLVPLMFFGLIVLGSTACQPAVVSAAGIVLGNAAAASEYFDQFNEADRNDRKHNAQIIVSVGRSRKLSDRDIAIAVATAIQESGLKNLPYGDLDSLGLFQQRPSQGWGSAEQIMDPVYASNKFYDALEKIGNRDQLSMMQAAQAVQRPAAGAYESRWKSEEDVAIQIVAGSAVNNSTASSGTASASPAINLADLSCRAPGQPENAVLAMRPITGDDYPYRNMPTWEQVGTEAAKSPLGYLYRECVDFASWRLNQQVGITSPPFKFGGMGDAKDWKAALSAHGFVVNSIPTVAAIAWWGPNTGDASLHSGDAGHVAVVSAVYPDGSIDIEQYNMKPYADHAYNKLTLQPAYYSQYVLFLAKAK